MRGRFFVRNRYVFVYCVYQFTWSFCTCQKKQIFLITKHKYAKDYFPYVTCLEITAKKVQLITAHINNKWQLFITHGLKYHCDCCGVHITILHIPQCFKSLRRGSIKCVKQLHVQYKKPFPLKTVNAFAGSVWHATDRLVEDLVGKGVI